MRGKQGCKGAATATGDNCTGPLHRPMAVAEPGMAGKNACIGAP